MRHVLPREPEPETLPPLLLLSLGAAERLVGIRGEQLRRYASQPGGPPIVRVSPRRNMFRRTDLLAWIESRTHRQPLALAGTLKVKAATAET
jgi:hypothetical protein